MSSVREHEPFDIILHCPDARTVDDIRRLEEIGVTDLQVTPWTLPGSVQVEQGIFQHASTTTAGHEMRAIRRFADEVIAR